MELFASCGIFDTIVISIDIETGLCQHCNNEFQVIGWQIATAKNRLDALKSLFDIQAIYCWHDLVADGQELHRLFAPAQKQRPPAALAQSYQKSPLPSWPSEQSLLCVLYHKSIHKAVRSSRFSHQS